ncbi:DUF4112 domain-containing protein [Roseibacterium beibuensis]|uniref:DUF4112 domain-containing protein n=1 Tax=[Roseibacterium] beibuensis TaxID=1193142 RepID=UPI00217E6EA7|nr:DUF4112 domain-containing protein [Roseibacterium beibuensis]MCS6627163.1 DUF4112 domain-containing protein [Roseibacterium beibuensis]
MARRTIGDIEKIWTNVEGVKKLSDRAIGIGPFGIGLDGLLTWVPVVGTVYSVGAAGWLLVQAGRVKASPVTFARMIGYLGLDSLTTMIGEIPFLDFVPSVVDVLFPGHLMAAKALQKDIETTHWVEASERKARASGDHERHVAEMRSKGGLRRVAYLHD